MENIKQWHEARHQDVTSRFGDLALEMLLEITEEATFSNIPGSWKPDLERGLGLVAQFTADHGVLTEEGHLIDGEVLLHIDQNYVCLPDSRYAMATSQPGSPYLLAIYNEKHEALSRFSHIEHYDYNHEHVYIGKYKQVEDQSFTFLHTGDVEGSIHQAGRSHESSAIIEVDIEGVTYQLRPFASGHNEIIVFRDTTSQAETYSVGRMIVVEKLKNGMAKLDFNKAFLPPCAFSPCFNCPMPPLSNRIGTAIAAGEINVIWTSCYKR